MARLSGIRRRLLFFFMFAELHMVTGAFKREVFGMVDGSAKFALLSTISLVLVTILSLFRKSAVDSSVLDRSGGAHDCAGDPGIWR